MKLQNFTSDKRRFVFLTLCILCIVCAGKSFAQNFKTLQDGIEYAEIKRGTETEPVKINLLRLDLTKVRLDVVHALDAAIGLERTSSMATRHGAFAAINAGFFRLDKSIFAGDATGALMINGEVFSESYADRFALLIKNGKSKTNVSFQYLNLNVYGRIGNRTLDISGINRERKNDELILFTPKFNRTTLTDSRGLEIVIKNRKVIEIIDQKGNTPIPSNGFVLSANGKRREELLKQFKIGGKADIGKPLLLTQLSGKKGFIISQYEDIISGVPALISFGKIRITWEQEKSSKSFVETRHPRTAVAKLEDGKFLMVTIDGRQKESVGMNLNELAALLLELGATDAMNLDGGGSTTMFVDGKVINQPSDKEGERRVSDAILIFPRKRN